MSRRHVQRLVQARSHANAMLDTVVVVLLALVLPSIHALSITVVVTSRLSVSARDQVQINANARSIILGAVKTVSLLTCAQHTLTLFRTEDAL